MKRDPYAPLRSTAAPTHWRSLEHKDGDESVTGAYDVEFPNGLAPATGSWSRRDAMKLSGASIAFGMLSACIARRPEEGILPFVKMPENVIPGVRLLYATAMQRSAGALGLLVEAHEGRPTKIEGNPKHPSSGGASDGWAQAEILKLYDPDRARSPLSNGQPASWADWDKTASELAGRFAANGGQGLAILAETFTGPTSERLLASIVEKMPQAKVYRHDRLAPVNALAGAELAYGSGARAHYDLTGVKAIFSLEADFLGSGPDQLKHARAWGQSRKVEAAGDVAQMKRIYMSEAAFSATGSNADHRLRRASGQQVEVLNALAAALGKSGVGLSAELAAGGQLDEAAAKFVEVAAKDLAANRGTALVMVGETQPPALHALGLAINVALGALESGALTISTGRPLPVDTIAGLTGALDAGQIDTLVVIDANPVYTAPGALEFADAIAKAKTVVHVGVLPEETGFKAAWHLPGTHFLEAWGDAEGWDGTTSIVQPLILPLHGARPAISILAQLAGIKGTDKELVEATWRTEGSALQAASTWRRALHDGFVDGIKRAPLAAELNTGNVSAELRKVAVKPATQESLELIATQGHLRDGRLSNISWMMEMPDSMSKLCWDNAVLMAPSLARALGIESAVYKNAYKSDLVELTVDGRTITAPTFVLPGLAPFSLTLHDGFGRSAGEVAKGIGVAVNPLLNEGSVVSGVSLRKTGATTELCSTQDHFSVPGNPLKEMTFAEMSAAAAGTAERKLAFKRRPLFRSGTAAEYATDPAKIAKEGSIPDNLLDERKAKPGRPSRPIQPHSEVTYEGQQWGMVIDLSSCTGCNSCAIACIAENNIPVVGREQVMLGREMHWLRIDRYYTGDVDQPQAAHQPVACMHCENAPCEPVCPVGATVHDEEGLNSMAYQRCIGTRYCANNCPYKVRRFNYLDFTHTGDVYVEPKWKERMKTEKLQRNPDVSVRYRGVMEKCTYCTQRVEEAKIMAKRDGKDRKGLPDGAVVPACQQACATGSITFGNINDSHSRVFALKQSPRNYEMLQELNVRPRTSYLARVRNENEELS